MCTIRCGGTCPARSTIGRWLISLLELSMYIKGGGASTSKTHDV